MAPDVHNREPFTGHPVIITNYPNAIIDFPPPPVNCNTSLEQPLLCNVNYGFYYNFTNPWPNGNCQVMVLGEVLLNGNVVYSQTNVTQATPLTYTFPGAGNYCVRFKLMVNGLICDVCTVCFIVNCNQPCICNQDFHFTGNPVILGFPQQITCNTSIATPLNCNLPYSFYIPYQSPWPAGTCQAMVVGEVLLNGNTVVYTQNNISQANPLNYTFTGGGVYCVRFKLVVNGAVCDVCMFCFNVNCDVPCTCNQGFHFEGNPVIKANVPHGIIDFPPPPIQCSTTLESPLACNISYSAWYNFTNPWPHGNCEVMVVAEVLLNGNVVYTQNNVTQATPLTYTFPGAGNYCVRFKLMVNGIVCDICTVCFIVRCEQPCVCNPNVHFTGNPMIVPNIHIPHGITTGGGTLPAVSCNTSLATPLICNTSYNFWYNYTNPYPPGAGCVVKDSAVIVRQGNPIPLAINPNTSSGNPLMYTFTQSGVYCVKYYLVVNGQVCDVCVVCFTVNCPTACCITVSTKLFLQGYYVAGTGHTMQPVFNNEAVPNSLPTEADIIVVELHDPQTYELVDAQWTILNTDGTATVPFTQSAGSYYIAIKHRNTVKTWSANPIDCSDNTALYDFTTAPDKAYANNQVQVEPGVWAFFTGDINQDEFIDGNDFSAYDNDSFNGVSFIYVATDLNGDGFVDGNDFSIFDNNSFNGVTAAHP